MRKYKHFVPKFDGIRNNIFITFCFRPKSKYINKLLDVQM